MNERDTTVEHMKKITLLLEATTADHDTPLVKESFDFIYGVGVRGLSPFEVALDGKKEGDELIFHLRSEELDGFFQHLSLPFQSIPEQVRALLLKVRISKVSRADQKEVIKAMAEATACSSGCCGH